MKSDHMNKEAFWKEIAGLVKTKKANKLIKDMVGKADDYIAGAGYRQYGAAGIIDKFPKELSFLAPLKRTINKKLDAVSRSMKTNYTVIPAQSTALGKVPNTVVAVKPNIIGRLRHPLHRVLETKTERAATNALGKLHEAWEARSMSQYGGPVSGIGFIKPISGFGSTLKNRLGSMAGPKGLTIGEWTNKVPGNHFYDINRGFGKGVGVHSGLLPLAYEMEAMGKMKAHPALSSVVKRWGKTRAKTGEYNMIRSILGYDPMKTGVKAIEGLNMKATREILSNPVRYAKDLSILGAEKHIDFDLGGIWT